MGEMKKFVFIDESIRDQYTIAAVIVPTDRVKEYRREMKTLRAKGARSFHMSKERPTRQKGAIAALSALQYCSFTFSSTPLTHKPEARAIAFSEVLSQLDDRDEHALVIDQTTMEQIDRSLLFTERKRRVSALEFMHIQNSQDPGLWGADILAWSIRTKFQKHFFWKGG
jgi:hypothetical protein